METLQFNEIPTQLLGEIKTDQLSCSDKEYIISVYITTLYWILMTNMYYV